MSQMPALARPSARVSRRTETQRPQLRVVPAEPRAPRRLPFVLLCSFLLAAGLMALLFLNMALAQGSYALHTLQGQSTQLEEDASTLRESLAGEAAPARLADRAIKLGMVPGAAPAFLRLPDGQVLGVPQPAPAEATPSSPAASGPSGSATPSSSSSATSSATSAPSKTESGPAPEPANGAGSQAIRSSGPSAGSTSPGR